MKALYPAAWLMIILFLGWSGNLLLNIQEVWSETSDLHKLSNNLDAMVETWRNLNKPGNDVLENYEVTKQRLAFEAYAEKFETALAVVLENTRGERTLTPLLDTLESEQIMATALAQEIFSLTELRESLRLSGESEESIREKETEAANRMALMDQSFHKGLDYILTAKNAVLEHVQRLEAQQRVNFKQLYLMLLVALVASALSAELLRRTLRQRKSLSDSATRINTIMNNVIDGIVTVDENGRIESVSTPAAKIFKCSTDKWLGQDFPVLLDEGSRNIYYDRISHGSELVVPSFESSEFEMRGRYPDGTAFPIELAVKRVVIQGRVLLIHIVRDITDRKIADERQRLAASVFENATEGILITDVNGTIQFVNPAFTTITQYEAKEAIGQNPRILQSGKQDRQFYESMWNSILELGRWQGEIWNRRRNGEIFPQWLTISAIKDNWGGITNYVGITWDISERKRAEEDTKQHQEELAHVMRLSTMGEMASGMAHELNQPLTAVASYCEAACKMLDKQPTIPEKLGDILKRAQEQAYRAGDIIRRLRQFVGKGTTQKDIVEIDKLIHSALNFLEWELRDTRVNIEFNHCGHDCRSMVDKVQIEQVLLNLVRNSLDSIRNAGINEGRVLLKTRILPGNMIEVTVSDNGPGIGEEMIDRLFHPFQTDKETGMGMGLSISRSIIEAHGGKLWAGVASKEGAVFGFNLPLADG